MHVTHTHTHTHTHPRIGKVEEGSKCGCCPSHRAYVPELTGNADDFHGGGGFGSGGGGGYGVDAPASSARAAVMLQQV